MGDIDQEDRSFKSACVNKSRDPTRKYPIKNRAGGVAQVLESLLCKHEALSSNPTIEKYKTKHKSLEERN
jgi:hypothetical protein